MGLLICLPVLVYAGVLDWIKRIIPNLVSIILLIIGIAEIVAAPYLQFYISIGERITGLLIPGVILFFIYLFNPKLSGGGDLKLLASLGFCIGIYNLSYVMCIACLGGICHCIIYKDKYIPLGTYIMLGTFVISTLYILWR